ncbi:MAG TPA: aldehyde dehydrogenase family protein [Candidatus Xenobia bacterium]|jgi:aldehyde dehydrogenase (NAD+)
MPSEVAQVDHARLLARQKTRFSAYLRHTTAAERLRRLRSLRQWIQRHQGEIEEAIYQDMRKPSAEVALTDIKPVLTELREARAHLHTWMQSKWVPSPSYLLTASARIRYEPKGVSLILAPWNFPFMLSISPLVSAIAAGNCVVLKPSELAPHTAELISKMLGELFDPDEVAVVLGGVDVSTELLKLPFDHIFFTGSPQVGRVVMRAAAEHLSSVTLELGGCNPVFVDATADIQDTAEKLAWGKFMNNGQSCVSPNFVLVDQRVQTDLVTALKAQVERFYGREPGQSTSYARIINARHTARLRQLLTASVDLGAEVVTGGVAREEDNYIAPTILNDVPWAAPVMQEEIFGPILPVAGYHKLSDALGEVQRKEKPLALYIFSRNADNIRYILENTTAGATCINETTVHFAHPRLPFGGVNTSGIGKAHGHAGFLAFTNERAVLEQRTGFTFVKLAYPPYTEFKKGLIQALTWWL